MGFCRSAIFLYVVEILKKMDEIKPYFIYTNTNIAISHNNIVFIKIQGWHWQWHFVIGTWFPKNDPVQSSYCTVDCLHKTIEKTLGGQFEAIVNIIVCSQFLWWRSSPHVCVFIVGDISLGCQFTTYVCIFFTGENVLSTLFLHDVATGKWLRYFNNQVLCM